MVDSCISRYLMYDFDYSKIFRLRTIYLWYFNKNFLCEKLFKNKFQVVDKILKNNKRKKY